MKMIKSKEQNADSNKLQYRFRENFCFKKF